MQIDSKEIKDILIQKKNEFVAVLGRNPPKRATIALDEHVKALEGLIVWIDKSEKQGEVTMDSLKLGEITSWIPAPKEGSVDELIIQDAETLVKTVQKDPKKNAIKINVKEVSWNTISGRAYVLRAEGKISANIVPRQDKRTGDAFLVHMPVAPKKRSKRGVEAWATSLGVKNVTLRFAS